MDQYSIPRYHRFNPNEPGEGPLGTLSRTNNAPYLDIKPILVKVPEYFKGEHDDMERFFGDCITYFEGHRKYFQNLPSLMVPFAASHFTGDAKSWWVHQ